MLLMAKFEGLVVQQPIKERGCVKMMHPLFRYRTIGFSFFIEYDSFFPVSMLSGGIICRRWLMPPLYFDNFCLSSSHS